MAKRDHYYTQFEDGRFYHIYNRGTDKRSIFLDNADLDRFMKYMRLLNKTSPLRNLRDREKLIESNDTEPRLVEFVAYCLNHNHFHFILSPIEVRGIEIFMQRLGTAYVMYFNNRYDRSGALFQGKFKDKHVNSNEYLLHLSAYVNLNDKTHGLPRGKASGKIRSSWQEYLNTQSEKICNKDIVLEQFQNRQEYVDFALATLADIQMRKHDEVLEGMLIDHE